MALTLLRRDSCSSKYPKDEDLIEGLKKNESMSLDCLYKMSFAQVKKFIVNNNGSEQDAEDVFQEAVLAVWKQIKENRFEQGRAKLSTYVFQVSKFRWYEQLKSARKKYNTRLNPEFDVESIDNLEEQEEQISQAKYLASLFERLGEKCQQLLKLYYYEKKPMVEIATTLGYSGASAKNEKYRCMQRMRKMHTAS